MNTHKHARLTFSRRLEMVQQMTQQGLSAVQVAACHGVTAPTARKWLSRYLAFGEPGLADASSKPYSSPRALASWQHHYNWHRPHVGIGGQVPMSSLNTSRNNVLTLYTSFVNRHERPSCKARVIKISDSVFLRGESNAI